MKKLLLATVVAGLMSTGAFAGWANNTTVNYVISKAAGTYVGLKAGTVNFQVKMPDARKKEMTAIALTALSTGKTLNVNSVSGVAQDMRINK